MIPKSYDYNIIAMLRGFYGIQGTVLAKQAGISKASLSNIENNKAAPQYKTLMAIADAFDITTPDLNFLAERLYYAKKSEDPNAWRDLVSKGILKGMCEWR